MGNKLVRKRHQVDEKYTRPQGLYQHKDVDHKKLRKLILDSKLAPCYPGDDDCNCDLEECPICFLVCVTVSIQIALQLPNPVYITWLIFLLACYVVIQLWFNFVFLFQYYPSLNRSRCCMKGICTECFLQMKMPNSTRPTQYPFRFF